MRISRNALLRRLVDSLYSRTEIDLRPGQFRVKGDTVDIMLSFEEIQLRIVFWGDEIEKYRPLTRLRELLLRISRDSISIQPTFS